MRHDTQEGLVHFTGYELSLIHERRSPIDYRAMPVIALRVEMLAHACAAELGELYVCHEAGMWAERPTAIERLRKRSADLEALAIGTRIIADNVELETLQTVR